MELTKAQQVLITKARNPGGSDLGVFLDDATCAYLAAIIVSDLGAGHHFPAISSSIPPFFGLSNLSTLRLEGIAPLPFLAQLFAIHADADTYFYCLATLHKARLKYERILQAQAIPTIDQVGPRALLQYGMLPPKSLVGLMFWRKWMFDIDNRAGQETGYVFEPIISYAIGGIPVSATRSPIKRGGTGSLGRQVDCITGKRAYEIKLRVTIAASGQGRWSEELAFPQDCQASGFTPVLIVLDPTTNLKLNELRQAFLNVGGESYVGQAAWNHLATVAGPTMARFLELYVHVPLQALLQEVTEELPDLTLRMSNGQIVLEVGPDYLVIPRNGLEKLETVNDDLPDDVDEAGPTL